MDLCKLVDKDNNNVNTIKCPRCPSIILLPGKAQLHKHEAGIFLQHIKKANAQGDSKGETLHDYWIVHDMFTFENVGFSNTTNNIKYLICADCEVGPIGAQFLDNKDNIYLAIDRVEMSTSMSS